MVRDAEQERLEYVRRRHGPARHVALQRRHGPVESLRLHKLTHTHAHTGTSRCPPAPTYGPVESLRLRAHTHTGPERGEALRHWAPQIRDSDQARPATRIRPAP